MSEEVQQKTVTDLLKEDFDCDKKNCSDFQVEFGYGAPPIEARISFLEWRMKFWLPRIALYLKMQDEEIQRLKADKQSQR